MRERGERRCDRGRASEKRGLWGDNEGKEGERLRERKKLEDRGNKKERERERREKE